MVLGGRRRRRGLLAAADASRTQPFIYVWWDLIFACRCCARVGTRPASTSCCCGAHAVHAR